MGLHRGRIQKVSLGFIWVELDSRPTATLGIDQQSHKHLVLSRLAMRELSSGQVLPEYSMY